MVFFLLGGLSFGRLKALYVLQNYIKITNLQTLCLKFLFYSPGCVLWEFLANFAVENIDRHEHHFRYGGQDFSGT